MEKIKEKKCLDTYIYIYIYIKKKEKKLFGNKEN